MSLLLLSTMFSSTGAVAQLLSPGKLAKAHSSLEGLSNCLKCHEPGNKLTNARCLSCHKAIATRASKRAGLHGQTATRVKTCASCHAEHRGLDHKLINWGPQGEKGFLHTRTGWPLQGPHAKAECKDCHQKRSFAAMDARKLLKVRPKTYLGVSTTCSACHFDEHRGQTNAKKRGCQHCHTVSEFKKAPKFKHNRDARFKLTGKHRRVRCKSCHNHKVEDETALTIYPTPRAKTFEAYEGIDFNQCTDCHRDPHKGDRGRRCQQCHSTRGWASLNTSAKDFGFHQKTRFPLKGAHVSVQCKTCHGPFQGERKAKYKNVPFERCADCHMDAHVGQLETTRDCVECHTVQRFAPSSFFVDEHAKARFPLEGAHRAVSCRACHTDDRGLARKVPRDVLRDRRRRGRPVTVSPMVLDRPEVKEACTDCHSDEHAGQMEAKPEGCRACHVQTSFTQVKFDHNKDARFALEGKHADVACNACHRPMTERPAKWKGALPVRYRPIETACATCHADVHLGQFQREGEASVACKDCHAASAFKPATFDHDGSRFPLKGKHRGVDCAKCHPSVEIRSGQTATWYRGVPMECADCHTDQHDSRFQEFTP